MHGDLVALARRQQGLLTVEQMGRRDPDWHEVQPGVLAPRVTVLTKEQQLEAISLHLDARTRATGKPWCFAATTAAELLGLRVPASGPVVVVQGSIASGLRGVTVLTARRLPRLRRIHGRPVPDVCTATVQCAAVLARDDLSTLVEHALRRHKCTLDGLAAVCGRGVSGSRALRSVILELSADGRDRWARALLRLLVAAGLLRPETERGVPAEAPLIYLDLCWWALGLAVEVDDWQSHGSRDASERDRERDRWLMRDYGITVLRVTPRQIRGKPDPVVQDIVAAYRRAERRRGTPPT
ncbi:MAG TPA: hypothetical protein VLR26_13230 [Frankiaceae bacterium]|nr:hypothetical protein [Frankiaceae bacterium]